MRSSRSLPRCSVQSATKPLIRQARYTPNAKFDIDLLFGRNLGGERKNWLTLGLTQRF
jgi:hypothetical protein